MTLAQKEALVAALLDSLDYPGDSTNVNASHTANNARRRSEADGRPCESATLAKSRSVD